MSRRRLWLEADAGVKEDAMLDHRISSATTQPSELASSRPRGASLADMPSARPEPRDDLTFGAVLSGAVTTRKARPASGKSRPAASPRAATQTKPAAARKTASRGGQQQSDLATPVEGQAVAAPLPAEKPDVATPAATTSQAGTTPETQPSAADVPAAVPSSAVSVDVSIAQQQASAAAQAALLVSAVDSSPATDASETSAGPSSGGASSVSSGTRVTAQTDPCPQADAGTMALPWMAGQPIARTDGKVSPAQDQADSPQVDGSIQVRQPKPSGQHPGHANPTQDSAASSDDPLAELLGQAKTSFDPFGAWKGTREKSSGTQATDAAASDAAPRDAEAPVVHPSATTDPTGLLNQAGLQITDGAGQAFRGESVSHVAVTPPAGMQADSSGLVPADSDVPSNMQRLATVVHAAAGQHQSVTRMQLQPPELGAVTAILQLRQNRMELKLEVASEAAKDAVTGGLDKLRDSLQQQGISLDRATVSVSPRSENAGNDQHSPTWSGQQGHASGQFDSGQGRQQGETPRQISFAIDAPVGTAASADAPAMAASYLAGLNVLA
jgi:flagellar hook-length control protein FliK